MVRPRRSPPPRTAPRVQNRALVLALLGIALLATLVIVAWKAGNSNNQAIVGLRSTQPTTPHGARVARLEVTAAHGTTRLEVHRGSVNGPLVFQGTLDRGKPHVFAARRLWLKLTSPDAVSVRLNGRVVPLPSGGAKTFVVTARRIRSSSGA
jgi:hypothetical protein